jgi:hypothetical protein
MTTDAKEFVGALFSARDYAHSAHLNTDSFSQHMALNTFYEEIVELADRFAEAWMGRHLEKLGIVPVLPQPKGEPLDILGRYLSFVEKNRDFVPKTDTPLHNIIDEIVGLFLSTIYKLKFLK